VTRALLSLALAVAVGALASASAIAAVPTTLGFSARLVDDKSGEPVEGPHRIAFELFDAATGGTSVWQEGREVTIEDGLLFTDIGQNRALDATVFDGRELWLEVKLDDVTMEPRIAIDSVPYAIRAATSDTVGDLAAADLQKRITSQCTPGNFIIGVNADGTVVCAPDLSGSGDVTAVFAGPGLQGGANSGDITLSLLQSCALDQILKWNGTTWICSADGGATASGDITSVMVGPAGGLAGGGSTGDVLLSLLSNCATNQILKWNGTSWGCANDLDTDTNSGGDITSVTTAIGTGLQGGVAMGDAALSLLTTCGVNQLLKWNGAAWTCASDLDTDTNSGGDITDVIAGNGLVNGGATGAVTLDVGAGQGISVAANTVALDTVFTDGRYVNATGDTMTGALDMGGFRITNRGCPGGYVLMGPGSNLCAENSDVGGHTFTSCSNRCRAAGTHMCSSAEIRAAMSSGVTLATIYTLDWMDDQSTDDNAFYVNGTDPANPDGVIATTTANWCRCCASVE
jgi:hypothetical protein